MPRRITSDLPVPELEVFALEKVPRKVVDKHAGDDVSPRATPREGQDEQQGVARLEEFRLLKALLEKVHHDWEDDTEREPDKEPLVPPVRAEQPRRTDRAPEDKVGIVTLAWSCQP